MLTIVFVPPSPRPLPPSQKWMDSFVHTQCGIILSVTISGDRELAENKFCSSIDRATGSGFWNALYLFIFSNYMLPFVAGEATSLAWKFILISGRKQILA